MERKSTDYSAHTPFPGDFTEDNTKIVITVDSGWSVEIPLIADT